MPRFPIAQNYHVNKQEANLPMMRVVTLSMIVVFGLLAILAIVLLVTVPGQ